MSIFFLAIFPTSILNILSPFEVRIGFPKFEYPGTFPVLHLNIRKNFEDLRKNFEDFKKLYKTPNLEFSIVCFSET